MRNLPKKKGYAKHVEALGEDLYAIEHVRGDGYNIAIVVLQDGRYFVGSAALNPKDQYDRRLGHEIAVGRALCAAITRPGTADGRLWEYDDAQLVGRELGVVCRIIADQW